MSRFYLLPAPVREIYSTSYCNRGHWIDTGRPVGHECYVVPTRLLIAERDGNLDAMVLWSEWLSSPARKRTVVGRPAPEIDADVLAADGGAFNESGSTRLEIGQD